MSVTCGGCGQEFAALPNYGACDDCQNEELGRQVEADMWRRLADEEAREAEYL